MPNGVTDYGAAAWIGALFGVTDPIAGYYLALCTDAPGIDADGTILADLEPDGGGYARQLYAAGPTNWGMDGGWVTSLSDIDFGVPSLDWGLLTHYALCTAASGGDLYAFGEFANPGYVSAGVQMLVPAGGIVLALSSLDVPIAL